MPYIVFAGSFPRQEEVRIAKASGARVLCFASNDSIAERMIAYGADALILEGSEAGGHIGHVSTMVLIQQVLFHYPQLPVFVAGGIATGRMIAHLLLMGAAGVQMGTIFAMAEESPAHPVFKERFRKARAREAFATPQYSSVAAGGGRARPEEQGQRGVRPPAAGADPEAGAAARSTAPRRSTKWKNTGWAPCAAPCRTATWSTAR